MANGGCEAIREDGGGARGPVAVIGAGLTGASWAGLFAAAGLEVRVQDVDAARLDAAAGRAAAAARCGGSGGAGRPGGGQPASTRTPSASDFGDTTGSPVTVSSCRLSTGLYQ